MSAHPLLALLLISCGDARRSSPSAAQRSKSVGEDSVLRGSDGLAYSYFGGAVAGAGDVNADGYADVIIGARGSDAEDDSAGAAYVYLGSAAGLESRSEQRLVASDSDENDFFGYTVGGGVDVDGDGFSDVVVGAPGEDEGGSAAGAAYLYSGSPAGVDKADEHKLVASDAYAFSSFGRAVSGAGDLDGDGYGDLVVGAPWDDREADSAGAVYVFYGGSAGLTEHRIVSPAPRAYVGFGSAVASAGDVDGDGYGDLIVGADLDTALSKATGAAYILYGSSTGVRSGGWDVLGPSDGLYGAFFGVSVSGAGDLDQDGFDDVAVGALGHAGIHDPSGVAYVFYGSASGASTASEQRLVASNATLGDDFGLAVAGGDINGDGYSDVVIGAQDQFDHTGTEAGAAYCYFGSAAGLSSTSEERLFASVGGSFDKFGGAVAVIGDADGDGVGDVLVGAVGPDIPSLEAGAAYVFYGELADNDSDGYPIDVDCDDSDPSIHPGAPEVCDGLDNDCDKKIDEDAVDAVEWFADADQDLYGDPASAARACSQPDGHVANGADCDDSDPDIRPGGAEVCGDGVDGDCDGRGGPDDDEDEDGLSYAQAQQAGTLECEPDTDQNGLSDGEEVLDHGTDPTRTDTDDGGRTDGEEVLTDGTDPLDPRDDAISGHGLGSCATAGGYTGRGGLLLGLLGLLGWRRRPLR